MIHKMQITTPISTGELLDKISILSIKSQYTNNQYVIKELEDLIQIAKESQVYNDSYLTKLFQVNQKLWKIEDDLRENIKKEINEKYKSTYQEVKCYV